MHYLTQELNERIARIISQRDTLISLESKLEELNLTPSLCGGSIDFDNLSHTDVIRVIQAFGGKWTKTLSEENIHYTRNEPIGSLYIRCYNGTPPPNCQIIEEEVEVPKEIIPAQTKVVRRLVCKP